MSFPLRSTPYLSLLIGLLFCASQSQAQSTASIQGQVTDSAAAVIPGAEVRIQCQGINLQRSATTDTGGRYEISALPVGEYRFEVQATGFKTQIVEDFKLAIGQHAAKNFQLEVGDVSQQVNVGSTGELVEHATISMGHVTEGRMVQDLPLNGRYFLDLGLLAPGSVISPQGAFSGSPMRGLGALAVNTAGNREEAVNYVINGISLNDLTFSAISFQPSITSVQEFKVVNSTFSAEYGQSSGAVVNIATRSGANSYHGELFEFFRNDALDARNFFTLTSTEPPPFTRNQFGGSFTGPLVKDRVFFFFSYEGLRQRQRLDTNSLVLSDVQRLQVTDPVILKLLPLIPSSTFIDSNGNTRFIGSANAPVKGDQWTIDIGYNLTNSDRLHAYYAFYDTLGTEPTRTGNTLPGFGNSTKTKRQVFTLNENHVFGPTLVNELRLGVSRFHAATTPASQINPADFGIRNGITEPIGLPQISVAGGGLNFGGPSAQPSGRGDTTVVVGDTLTYVRGKHSLRLGGEFRQFFNNNFRQGTGAFNFTSIANFIGGNASSFSVTLGSQSSSIKQSALGLFIQDNFKLRPNAMIELGLRYEWNMTPTERYDRFIVFDPVTASLVRIGSNEDVYHQNNKNVQPRIGLVWDPFKDGKTSVRAAYAILTDQPMTSVVTTTAANPPLAIPLTVTGTVRMDTAINQAGPTGLAPVSINRDFDNAYLQSWNFNVQREVLNNLVLMVGYVGSKGTHLIIRRNVNQFANGVRPFPRLSASSPILPNTPLGNITQVESAGNSSYNALWFTANQRLSRGLQLNASYTFSKSIDYNSFSTGGIIVQDSYNLSGSRGLSDFDARHRFVLSGIYDLPFKGNAFVDGWQVAAIVQSQSGSPINIVTSNTSVNGIINTVRPDVSGPIQKLGLVERWFDTSVFTAVSRFGNLGRNAVTGPGFNNVDLSVIKSTRFGEKLYMQCRVEVFDALNHANFGPPGNVVGSQTFGQITSTRFPTGESGSSRQVQLAIKFGF